VRGFIPWERKQLIEFRVSVDSCSVPSFRVFFKIQECNFLLPASHVMSHHRVGPRASASPSGPTYNQVTINFLRALSYVVVRYGYIRISWLCRKVRCYPKYILKVAHGCELKGEERQLPSSHLGPYPHQLSPIHPSPLAIIFGIYSRWPKMLYHGTNHQSLLFN